MRKIRRRRRKARPINVEEEKQVNTHSYKKTRVTKQQQKLINRRFKNENFQIQYGGNRSRHCDHRNRNILCAGSVPHRHQRHQRGDEQ